MLGSVVTERHSNRSTRDGMNAAHALCQHQHARLQVTGQLGRTAALAVSSVIIINAFVGAQRTAFVGAEFSAPSRT